MTAAVPPAPTTLDYRGVAALLLCSPKSVERRAADIPGRIKFGRLVRFDRAAVLAWIAAGCPSPK